jgi:hypothetical protein
MSRRCILVIIDFFRTKLTEPIGSVTSVAVAANGRWARNSKLPAKAQCRPALKGPLATRGQGSVTELGDTPRNRIFQHLIHVRDMSARPAPAHTHLDPYTQPVNTGFNRLISRNWLSGKCWPYRDAVAPITVFVQTKMTHSKVLMSESKEADFHLKQNNFQNF